MSLPVLSLPVLRSILTLTHFFARSKLTITTEVGGSNAEIKKSAPREGVRGVERERRCQGEKCKGIGDYRIKIDEGSIPFLSQVGRAE